MTDGNPTPKALLELESCPSLHAAWGLAVGSGEIGCVLYFVLSARNFMFAFAAHGLVGPASHAGPRPSPSIIRPRSMPAVPRPLGRSILAAHWWPRFEKEGQDLLLRSLASLGRVGEAGWWRQQRFGGRGRWWTNRPCLLQRMEMDHHGSHTAVGRWGLTR